MNILTGLYRPDEGEIDVFGRPVQFHSPRDAIGAGIGMVHQHFRLVDRLTVAENVILGWHTPRFWLERQAGVRRMREISDALGMPFPCTRRSGALRGRAAASRSSRRSSAARAFSSSTSRLPC